jgi:putative effector of murein hydrolase
MIHTIANTPMFGLALTFFTYGIGVLINRRLKSPFAHPMLIATILSIAVLVGFDIPLSAYQQGGDFLSLLIFPATTCLAVVVYEKIQLLKEQALPVLVGCTIGSLASIGSVWALAKVVGLPNVITFSITPKSVTAAIAIELAELMGGVASFAVMAVLISGLSIVMFAPILIKLFHIQDPIVQGVALGTSGHLLGTAKALEYGSAQGAMGGIALFITSLTTIAAVLLIF